MSGGEDTYFYGLIEALKKNRHQVKTYIKESSNNEVSWWEQITAIFSFGSTRQTYNELEDVLSSFKPDVVHCLNLFPFIGYAPYILCQKLNIPLIQRINNYRLICSSSSISQKIKNQLGYGCASFSRLNLLYISVIDLLYRRGVKNIPQLYLFPSRFTAQEHIKHRLIPSEKVVVSPDFFTHSSFLKKHKRSNYFLYYGRLSDEKGIKMLIQAFLSMKNRSLIVIGEGPLKKYVRDQASPNIQFYSRMNFKKLRPFIQKALFTIIPSKWYDVLPNVLVESFSQGTPVIVPNWGPFPNLVKHKYSGLLYKPASLTSFKKVINYASTHQYLSGEMTKNIKKEYKRNYSSSVSYQRLYSLYKKSLTV